MKIRFFLILIFSILTLSLFAQSREIKETSSKETEKGLNNTILYSAAIPIAPFGIKYIYCKTFGYYVSLKSDLGLLFDDTILSTGGMYSISKKVNCYLGSGYDFSWDTVEFEAGIIYRRGRFALDLGVGIIPEIEEFYATVGVGFNF
ncbi:MAG: hypothetical protein JW798_01970 [Prolixibacteraceae bacterium]|nr:hypothetical protein [Prolixibacteraceae bacterium]